MELQHVKEIILRSDKNMQRSASVEDSSSTNNLELDLTGLVESIGRILILLSTCFNQISFLKNSSI